MATGCAPEYPELSVEAEKDLASMVAESCGVDVSVAFIALRATNFDVEVAISLLIHGQCEAPIEVSLIADSNAFSDAVNSVADCCGVDVEIAATALKENNNDFDLTVHQLVYGLPSASDQIAASNSADYGTATCTSEVKQVFTIMTE